MEYTFNIGDRVAVFGYGGAFTDGDTGTIVDAGVGLCGVNLDSKIYAGHDCGGRCEMGHGWYIETEYLVPVRADEDVMDEDIAPKEDIFAFIGL